MKKVLMAVAVFFTPLVLSMLVATAVLAANVAKGKEVYHSLCWVCHGKYGRGDGPAGKNLQVKPRDLTDYKYISRKSDEELFQWVSGRHPNYRIPAHAAIWRETLTDVAVRNVVAYVRTLSGPTIKGSVAAGSDLFNSYCWVCHGRSGKGDGPAAAKLQPKPRDFTDAAFKARATDKELFDIISSGSHASAYMPMWGLTLSEQEIWDLVEYIKSLPAAKRKG